MSATAVSSTPAVRQHRRRLVGALAARQGGLVTQAQLCQLGVSWDARGAEVAAGRWLRAGEHTLLVPAAHTPGDRSTPLWRAVLETSPSAALGGSTALVEAGMAGWREDEPHVYVAKSADPAKPPGVRVHETRRWSRADAVDSGVPRARPAVAAVQGAAWAVSVRQAALLLVMPVQQRLCRAVEVREELHRCRRLRWSAVLRQVVDDVVDGAHSLGELDFAAMCRRRGLPEPNRQSLRRGRRGRVYLDVAWDRYRLTVEVDGIHHTWAGVSVDDVLRQNEVSLGRHRVLRVPLLGLRVAPEPFLEQVVQGLRAGGWAG